MKNEVTNTQLPTKYTITNMYDYIAKKHDIPKKQIKEILDSFFDLVEHGIISEQKVPLGQFGKMYAHLKPATKEREGTNPATGEKIIIKPKEAFRSPKFNFSKTFKETIKDKMK